jgi:hypothetical protein
MNNRNPIATLVDLQEAGMTELVILVGRWNDNGVGVGQGNGNGNRDKL